MNRSICTFGVTFRFVHFFCLALLWLTGAVSAQDRVFYLAGEGERMFHASFLLSDETILVSGAAANMNWLPAGVPTQLISPVAANGSSIRQEGVDSGLTAFILRLNSDGTEILGAVTFPHGQVDEVRYIKATTAPTAAQTGDLFISGTRGSTGGTGGYYIAKLNGNFLNGLPTGLAHVFNLNTRGKNNEHGLRQPWDVMSDGRVVAAWGRPYEDAWGEIRFLPAEPGPDVADSIDLPETVMPGWRFHVARNAEGQSVRVFGTADQAPPGFTSEFSRFITKTQRTNESGLLRSYTWEDFHSWRRDENGYWRRGKYPLDVFWNSHWIFPETGGDGGAINNMWLGDAHGYTGYRISGTGGGDGAPYTPRVGAITVDRRTDRIYIGKEWASRLPNSNNPDFEPALIVLDSTGALQWWARLYREYNDNSDTPPQSIEGTVTEVLAPNQFRSDALIGADIDLSRITSGSDGFINGRRRIHWRQGTGNYIRPSNITDFDPATGTVTVTLTSNPEIPIQIGEEFMVDATILTKTHTSTPDQYIDAIAIDYSTPVTAQGLNAILYVAARAHGNNVSNFWNGNQIAANPGGSGFLNGFTGTVGDIQQSWLGKYRDEGDRSTILGATYVAEYAHVGDFGSGNNLGGTDRSNPNYDFWPNQNAGWPDRNTTGIGARMHVDDQGRLVMFGVGRTVQTTAGAYQRNIRPFISGARMSEVHSASQFTAENMIGANLFLENCRVRWNNQTRTVIAFDNETGAFTLAEPFDSVPPLNAQFSVDEGVGNWGNFVRVYSADLSQLDYSTLFSSAVNPVDGVGTGSNTRIFSTLPLAGGRILVTGFHNNANGNPIPTVNAPAWGADLPEADTHTAVLGILSLTGAPPPVILSQPQSAQRQVGGSVSFTVVAEGQIESGGALTYQWTFDGQVIEGATSATLSLSNLTLSDAGLYRVGVTQEGLTTWSEGAVLSVEGSIPVIHSWPTASALELGQALGVSTLSGGSASVGGEFVFENPGLIPPAGTNPQIVRFLPSNPDLYETVTSEIPVTVIPPATAGVYRINFTNAVTDSDLHTYGSETWRRVNLQGNSSGGQFLPRNHSALVLPDISGSSGAVTFSAQASYTSAHTGAMQAPGEDLFPASGHSGNARFGWFDAGNAEMRRVHSYESNNRSWTFTFAGFSPTDEVTFEFVQRRPDSNRSGTLRYLPADGPAEVRYENLNIGSDGNAVYHRVTLSGATSYAFQLGPNGGWTGLFNAVSVTVAGAEDGFERWWNDNQHHFPGKVRTDSVVRQGFEIRIRDIWIAGLNPANEDLFRITGWDEHGRPEFAPRHDGRVYTTYWTADLTADPVVWTELDAEAHMPEESQIFFRVDVRWSDE